MTTVLVNGACGRMGQAVLKAVQDDKDLKLIGAVDIKGGADTGELVGLAPNGILVEKDLAAALERLKPEVMIDFTRPDVVFGNVVTALKHKVSPVVGTTGLSDAQEAEIKSLSVANGTPAFIAPNFAIGAVLMMVMCRQAAKYMPDVEIIELMRESLALAGMDKLRLEIGHMGLFLAMADAAVERSTSATAITPKAPAEVDSTMAVYACCSSRARMACSSGVKTFNSAIRRALPR